MLEHVLKKILFRKIRKSGNKKEKNDVPASSPAQFSFGRQGQGRRKGPGGGQGKGTSNTSSSSPKEMQPYSGVPWNKHNK